MTDNEIIKALNTAADKDFVKVYLWDDKPPKVTTISVADIVDLINRQKAEIERLQNGIEELNCKLDMANDSKVEAIKEFAERVKVLAKFNYIIWDEQIDYIVKEMVGDDDG